MTACTASPGPSGSSTRRSPARFVTALPFTACVAVGANLGNRLETIRHAIRELDERSDIDVIAVSTIIETDPVGVTDQGCFLNGAMVVRTALSPRGLLTVLLEIEPKTLIWTQGEDVKPMTFKLKVNHSKPMKILETSGTNGHTSSTPILR